MIFTTKIIFRIKMESYNYKIENFIKLRKTLNDFSILEFGVKRRSTKMFLDLCNSNSGKVTLFEYFNDKNWTFIQSKMMILIS